MAPNSVTPTEETLLKLLDIQWQDHFQTRSQTWKTLEISALLAVALVGLDWRLDNPLVTIVAASLLLLVGLFGTQITLRHRKVEETKFQIIASIEAQLGIADPNLKPPQPVSWWSLFLYMAVQHPIVHPQDAFCNSVVRSRVSRASLA